MTSASTAAMNRVALAIGSLPSVRVFRNNVGMGWTGEAVKLPGGNVMVKNARPLHAGLIKGSSDLIGWTTREIRTEHVGQRWAVFTAIEVKDGTGRPNPDQLKFIDAVKAAGGIAGVARGGEDALALLF